MARERDVVDQVQDDLSGRKALGRERYGRALRAHNGRDGLRDAYEEILDLACYIRQVLIEDDSRVAVHQMSLSELRSKASGWHFARESLTGEEHKMLEVIEELLREVDGTGFRHVWPSAAKSTPLDS